MGALPHGQGHPRARRCSVSQAQPAMPQLLEFWGSVTPWGESQRPPLTSGRAPRVPDRDVGQEPRGHPRLPSVNRRGRSTGPVRLPPLPEPGQPWPVAFSFFPLTSVEYRNYDEGDGKTKHSGAGLSPSWGRDSAVSRGCPAARRDSPPQHPSSTNPLGSRSLPKRCKRPGVCLAPCRLRGLSGSSRFACCHPNLADGVFTQVNEGVRGQEQAQTQLLGSL